MKRPLPAADATARQWGEFFHACMEQSFDEARGRSRTSLIGLIGVIVAVLALTGTLLKFGSDSVRWADGVDGRLTTLQGTLDLRAHAIDKNSEDIRRLECIQMIETKSLSAGEARDICGAPTSN